VVCPRKEKIHKPGKRRHYTEVGENEHLQGKGLKGKGVETGGGGIKLTQWRDRVKDRQRENGTEERERGEQKASKEGILCGRGKK